MPDSVELRLQNVFTEAVELGGDERAAYLDRACAGDAAFRARVEALLTAHSNAANFLAAPAGTHAGERIGRYKLLEVIGEGGFATVYRAEQAEPIRREVALKIIKLGMDTKQVIAHFEAERQALATLDHPNIAKVFDAGTTETGRPFFVMELVRGSPITKYCDEHNLQPRQRLELFIPICQAVQHAHQKGIIHRDIKPNNVLVTVMDGRAIAKVIDFGIAKAVQSRLTERTLFTELGQFIGTPAYMSPEQAGFGNSDIDTRADIYSLGVLLYELLTGTTPIEESTLRGAAYDQVQKLIREHEPPKPSTRLSTMGDAIASVAALRRIEPRQLSRFVRDELDWIVMKCLEKERARRYESAAALGADIQRQLAGEAVLAGPPSALYRIKKAAVRHRIALGAACVALAATSAGTIVYVRGIRVEQRKTEMALREARAQRDVASAVGEFLTERVLAGASPDRLPDKAARNAIVKAMLDPASAGVGVSFKDKPLTEAAVRDSIAISYNAVGRADLGLPHARAALELCRRTVGDDDPRTLNAINTLGILLQSMTELEPAEALFREALERCRRVLGDDHPTTIAAIFNMGRVLKAAGKLDPVEQHFREALERGRRILGDDHPSTIDYMCYLGNLLHRRERLAEAEPYRREALERCRRVFGNDHMLTISAINNMAALLKDQGKVDESAPFHHEMLERCRRVLGDDHPDTMRSILNMAFFHYAKEEFDQAEALFREGLERRRRVLGNEHIITLETIDTLGSFLGLRGKLDLAEPLYREAFERKSNPSLGPQHAFTKHFAGHLANCLDGLGRREEAAALRSEFGISKPSPATGPSTAPATRTS